jgi:hypothetical protein
MIALGIASIFLAMLLAATGLAVKEFIGPMAVVYFAPILIWAGQRCSFACSMPSVPWAADFQNQIRHYPELLAILAR